MPIGIDTQVSDSVSEHLSDVQAVNLQWEFLREWKPKSDVWALLYGPGVLSLASGVTGLLINQYYRRKLKLASYGHFSSYLPIVALPTLCAAIFHRVIVSSPIVLQQQECPICIETRSVVLQNLLSVVYPMVLGPAGTYMLASRYNTVRIPALNKGFGPYWNFHLSTSKGLIRMLPKIIAVNSIAAAVVTYMEFENMDKVNRKMLDVIQLAEERKFLGG